MIQYLDKNTGLYQTTGEHWWKSGTNTFYAETNKITILSLTETAKKLEEEACFHIEIDGNLCVPECKINEQTVGMEQYTNEKAKFNNDYSPIYLTEFEFIYQYDCETPDEIVDMLLSSEQKFILP